MSAGNRALGRTYPKHFDHVEAHPLRDEDIATPVIQPVAPGVNWYTSFDRPVQGSDGKFYVPSKKLGMIRGGHCFCLCPPSLLARDSEHNWAFYNQGEEGACEGFGHSRRFSILYGKTFDAFHLYDDGQRIEGSYQPNGGSEDSGSTNDAICQALHKWGIHSQTGAEAHRTTKPVQAGTLETSSYKWATSVEQILTVLGISDGSAIPFLNSWGKDYPHEVYMPPETLERLLKEGGECDVLTDAS
jgi:hypothetical protein